MFIFDSDRSAIALDWVDPAHWAKGQPKLSPAQKQFATAQGFTAGPGQLCILPDEAGAVAHVILGGAGQDVGIIETLPRRLPAGAYVLLINGARPQNREAIAHAWADGCYQFDMYKQAKPIRARLVLSAGDEYLLHEARTLHHLRDWVNTPAEDLNPQSFADIMAETADQFGAAYEAIVGEALLAENYPMIHAVGRAGDHAPRYCELRWNADKTDLPLLALVGKGVCYDTGGLNIKTGNYMRLMKKDMGGAAHALALAQLVMAANLPVRLHLGIPLVENNIAANAFRPGDVFATRKGVSVEIDNTDAEGRLVLADALTKACESVPDLLLDFATLTGAARVALGPDLAPLYTEDTILAAEVAACGQTVGDPVWPMPLWSPYTRYLKSSIADMQNAGGRMAGSITAALFLKTFVSAPQWAHLDVWAWREAQNGSPEGAYPCGIRAVWAYLQARFEDLN